MNVRKRAGVRKESRKTKEKKRVFISYPRARTALFQ
jgi:hypothetical protein